MEALRVVGREILHALRVLRRAPIISALTLVTLALGIGANAAIFSVANALLLRPLPYAAPEQVVRLYESMKDEPGWHGSVSFPNLADWRAQATSIAGFVAFSRGGRNLLSGGEAQRLSVVEVSANAFAVLRSPTLLGRGFLPGEDERGRERVAVLSEQAWRARFGGDPGAIGREIVLDGAPHRVLGVMPASFAFPAGSAAPDLWLPLVAPADARTARGSHMLNVVARLAPGATLERARDEMRQIAARIEAAYPNEQANRTVAVVPYQEDVVGNVRPALLVLLGAVALLLLIACANVANLLLAFAAERRGETAVRLALGASRARLVRQYLWESMLLAVGGAFLGSALAWLGLRALTGLVPPSGVPGLPLGTGVPLDWRVFAHLLVISVGSGLLFGLAPALQTSPDRVRDALASSGATGGKATAARAQHRMRGLLVVAQLALSIVLLVGAGLLMRAFVTLRNTPSGLRPDGVVVASLAVPGEQYGATLPEQVAQLHYPVLERVRALPGVAAAGLTSRVPVEEWGTNGDYWIDGRPAPQPGHAPLVELRQVSPGYFAALGLAMRMGRDFAETDGAEPGADPVVVNEALVRREFGPAARPGDVLGQRIRRGPDSTDVSTIVGVVADVRQTGLERPPAPEMYYPYRSRVADFGPRRLVVRAAGGSPALSPAFVAAVRGAVAAVAPDVPVHALRTLDEVLGRSLATRRLNLWLVGTFAVVAVLLAASGLYGVMSYTVAQRSRELGIRMALGAGGRAVVGHVLRHGLVLLAAGVGLGVAGALAASQALATMLYGVGARDPLTFAAAPVLLAVVALVAAYVPARRAARANPMAVLRGQ
jgi:predicted permease